MRHESIKQEIITDEEDFTFVDGLFREKHTGRILRFIPATDLKLPRPKETQWMKQDLLKTQLLLRKILGK